MDVKLCRLVTGETVVGKLVEETLVNCLLLQAVPEPGSNAIRMGISPYWAPYSRDEADIPASSIAVQTIADPQLLEQYMQITSTIIPATPADLKNITGQQIQFPG